jgi:rhamnose transport system ATP-binding protein
VSLLRATELTKSFAAVRALRGVSFDLRAGEVHALLGENGAGKSTLIKIIAGAHAPDGGTLEIAGEAVTHFTPREAHRRGIACIYQQPALFPDLSVAENIALRLATPSALRLVRPAAQRAQPAELLRRIGADLAPEKTVRTLSMPEQQLVEIACALGAGARVVIMDEPTASLTRKEQQQLFTIVRDLRAGGIGVIYISHRLEEILALADRVTVLRDGASVGTREITEVSEASLIALMVGREVTHIYPPAESVPGEVVLALRGLGCQAAGLAGIDLELRAGEVMGLAGLVGAGRTELARVLFGLTPADSGEILLHGQRVTVRSPREAIAHGLAYVPEDRRRHGIVLEMSVAENITLASHAAHFPGGWLRPSAEVTVAREFIRDLGIRTAGPSAQGASLSGGNQQKVSVARWLATRPRVLILDEPTQGVDVGAKAEIHKIIRTLARGGMAVLLISSDLPEVLGMSDRIAVMRGGRLAAILPAGTAAPAVMAAALGKEAA